MKDWKGNRRSNNICISFIQHMKLIISQKMRASEHDRKVGQRGSRAKRGEMMKRGATKIWETRSSRQHLGNENKARALLGPGLPTMY